MRLLLRERIIPLAILLGIGCALPVGLLLAFGNRMVMFGMAVHFVGVGVSALCATAVSLALTIVGVRRNDGRVVLIGTGFTVMSALLAIHGLATPGVIVGMNGVISLTGAATLPAGAGDQPVARPDHASRCRPRLRCAGRAPWARCSHCRRSASSPSSSSA